MKKIEDYLHYHLKCWGTIIQSECENYGIGNWGLSAAILHQALIGNLTFIPHLRPLSNITYDEFIEAGKIHIACGGKIEFSYEMIKGKHHESGEFPEVIHHLLSKHFDLFGLIPAGLAIDKTTVQ